MRSGIEIGPNSSGGRRGAEAGALAVLSPKNALCKTRNVYATPTRMPTPAKTAIVGNVCHAPMSTCNSATNPLKPGSPIDATLAMTKVTAANGSAWLRFIPSSALSSRVCVRS